jgi:RHS repeat-associated protein
VADTLLASGNYDDQDRLKEYGGADYTYGPNGELTSKTIGGQPTTYEYDAFGNLRTVVLPTTPPTTIEYLVDGKNRRVGKKVDGMLVQRLFYGDQLNPVAWIDEQGDLAQFVYGTRSNVPDYMIKNGVTYRIVSDHLGSVRLLANEATGDVVQQINYDEFGSATVIVGTWTVQPFAFAGGIYDPDTSLARFGARDYDPKIGRWTAKDPIRFNAADSNLYGYVANEPVNRVDPSGLVCCDECKGRLKRNLRTCLGTAGVGVGACLLVCIPEGIATRGVLYGPCVRHCLGFVGGLAAACVGASVVDYMVCQFQCG